MIVNRHFRSALNYTVYCVMTWAHFCEQSAQSRLATEQPYSSQAYEHL